MNYLVIMSEAERRVSNGHSLSTDPNRRAAESTSPLSALNRRRFLAFTSGCFLGVAGGATQAVAGAFKPIDVGALKDYPRDGISEKFVQNNFFVIRNRGRLYATIATCPHKGNYLLLNPKDATRIICSGHDSVFNADGLYVSGKARGSLARLGITLSPQGRVLVDTNREFPQPQWNDKASFVAVR